MNLIKSAPDLLEPFEMDQNPSKIDQNQSQIDQFNQNGGEKIVIFDRFRSIFNLLIDILIKNGSKSFLIKQKERGEMLLSILKISATIHIKGVL